SIQQGRADRLRRPIVHVVNDRLYGFRYLGRRVLFLQTMAGNVTLFNVFVYRRGIVEVGDAKVTGSRIGLTWGIIVVGEFDERMMLAKGNSLRVGSYAAHNKATIVAGESKGRFELGVFWEVFGAWQV